MFSDENSSNKSSISSINSNISSLNSKVSTNTNNINSINSSISSLTTKANSNTSSISSLSGRVTTLESSGSHYWEYIGTGARGTFNKKYNFVIVITSSNSNTYSGIKIIGPVKRGETYEFLGNNNYYYLGYV